MSVQPPLKITLEAHRIDYSRRSKAHPYADAYFVFVHHMDKYWCPWKLEDSSAFNYIDRAFEDFLEKYHRAKKDYLAAGGEDFIDPEFDVHSIYA